MRRSLGWLSGCGKKGKVSRNIRLAVDGMERREMLTVGVAPIADVSLPATKTIFVPVDGTDSGGKAISYTVSSSNSAVKAAVRSGHPYLKLSVFGYGDMVFQLFDDLAPNTVQQITKLVNQGFYNNLTFHRIVKDFVIQGGDPKGDGSGGPGFQFDNEYSAKSIFTGDGQLAMANSGVNTNGSQFFVTVGKQRFLDFNYNLFGQIVEGKDVLKAINNVPTNSSSKPNTAVTITSASIIQNNDDTVLEIDAPAGAGSSVITVTAKSADGSTTTKSFTASYQADTTNDPPYLGPLASKTIPANKTITIPINGADLENDALVYTATVTDGAANATVSVSGNNLTITPKTDFLGTVKIQVGVQQQGATARGSTSDPRDLRTISVTVANPFVSLRPSVIDTAEDAAGSKTFATFASNTDADISDFKATIQFGDGTVSEGTIVSDTSKTFRVVSTHGYADPGQYETKVIVSGPGGAAVPTFGNVFVSSTSAAGNFGGGRVDTSIPKVAGSGSNYTSASFAEALGTKRGLQAIVNRFGQNASTSQLDAGLVRLAGSIPGASTALLSTWRQHVTSANLTGNNTPAARRNLRLQLRQDLIGYLADHIGRTLNVLKSPGSRATDKLLTFNGKV